MKPLEKIQSLDVSAMSKIMSAKHYPDLLPASRLVSAMGDGWLYALTGLLSLSVLGSANGYFWGLLLAFAMERPLYYILKNSLKRNRPFRVMPIQHHVNPSDQFSFPSGHTSAAFLFAIISGHAAPVLWLPLLVWAFLVGCSRVILGVHFITDILVGAVMGIGMANLALLLLN